METYKQARQQTQLIGVKSYMDMKLLSVKSDNDNFAGSVFCPQNRSKSQDLREDPLISIFRKTGRAQCPHRHLH